MAYFPFKFLKFKKKDSPRIIAGSFNQGRAQIIRYVFVFTFAAILIRAVSIHIFPPSPEFLERLAKHQYSKKIELATYRGNIYDRRGEPLAISIKKPSFYVNPRQFSPSKTEIADLARLLHMPAERIQEIAEKRTYFSWVKRQISPDVATKIQSMKVEGLYEVREPTRFYPLGSAASQILGFVGIDNHGLGGMEYIYDKKLKGEVIDYTPAIDAHGSKIYLDSQYAIPYKPGSSVHLTLDRVLQEIAEEELEKGVKDSAAHGGIAIVSDPHTGQILAMANFPKFDPQNLATSGGDAAKNRAVVDIFEPGSITKSLVVATALEKGLIKIDEQHYCEKDGKLKVGGHYIHDDHPIPYLDTEGVVVKSSNICMYKIAQKLGPQGLSTALKRFGIGNADLRLGFAGEVGGRISSFESWRDIRFANIAFGQGFSVTGLEMVAAYGAIANGGQLYKPYLVSQVVSPSGETESIQSAEPLLRVISPETAESMRKILEEVTISGTGSKARTTLYTVAGKTGTAEVYSPEEGVYSKTKRKASFVGFAPAHDPQIVVFVMIDEPTRKPYYGGLWAAPVFSQIVARSLNYLNVKSDKMISSIDHRLEPQPAKL